MVIDLERQMLIPIDRVLAEDIKNWKPKEISKRKDYKSYSSRIRLFYESYVRKR